MAAAAEISDRWRHFADRAIWAKPAILKQLNYQWSSYMPLSSIKFHGAKVISMRCNGTNIACGEEGTGNVAIYRRKDITKKHYHRLGWRFKSYDHFRLTLSPIIIRTCGNSRHILGALLAEERS